MDGLGNPIYFQLTGGNIHDATVAVEVLSHLDISDSTILADKAYGTNEILDYIQQQDGDYAIPQNPIHATPGVVIGHSIRSAIWLSAFSLN